MVCAAMVDDSEFSDMSPAKVPEPPTLVGAIPQLRQLWFNPVFQRYYTRSRLRLYVAPRLAFIIALCYSSLVNGLFIFVPYGDSTFEVNAAYLMSFISVPVFFVVGFISLVVFYFCLVMTPVDLRRDAIPGEEDPIFTTPLTDRQIYLASCLPNFVKSLLIGESLLTMLLGIIIPSIPSAFVLINGFELDPLIVYEGGMAGVAIFLLVVITYILTALLLVLAAGMYASFLQPVGAIIATLVHYWIVTRLAGTVGIFAIFMPFAWGIDQPDESVVAVMLWYLLLEFLKRGLLVLGCWLTAMIGVGVFAGSRRPGNYYGPVTSRYKPGQ
jgi:hypothetical protein